MLFYCGLMNLILLQFYNSVYFVFKQADVIFSKMVKQKSTLAAGSSSACILIAHSQCAFLQLIYKLRWVLWSLLKLTLWNSRLNKWHRIINRLRVWIPRQVISLDLFAVLLGSYPSNTIYVPNFWPHKQTLLEAVVHLHSFVTFFRIWQWCMSPNDPLTCHNWQN